MTHMPKKSPGGPRSSFLTARIPEKTRFGLTLMSRLHHEPAPDILIRALNNLFSSEHIGLFVDFPGEELPKNLLELTWAERESDRLVNLAQVFPSLLTASEKLAWEEIRSTDTYWTTSKKGRELNRDAVAHDWPAIKERSAPGA